MGDKGITEARATFAGDMTDKAKREREKAKRFVRHLVPRMAAGEDFTTDDFMFAFSMGQPEAFAAQAELLHQAEKDTKGRLVAVVVKDRGPLAAIGIGSMVNPLVLGVEYSQADRGAAQSSRRLTAALRLNEAVYMERGRQSSSMAEIDILRYTGEPNPTPEATTNLLERELIIGPHAILRYFRDTEDQQTLNMIGDSLMYMVQAARLQEPTEPQT